MTSFKAITTGFAALVAAAALSFGSIGCSSSTASTPPTYAPITVFNGGPDVPAAVFRSNSVVLGTVPYGTSSTVQAQTGTGTSIEALNAAGTVLGSTSVAVDTTRLVWAFFSGLSQGSGANNNLTAISTVKPTIATGKSLIRAINASSNAPTLDIHLGDNNGPAIGTGIAWKSASPFVTLDSNMKVLSFTTSGDATNKQLFYLNLPAFTAGKYYTVMVYGSTAVVDSAAAGAPKLTAQTFIQ